jgi:sugar-specific transcriptional regulator TrmB
LENSALPNEYNKAKEELVIFGIPEREATIYFALLMRGESKAGELSSYLRLHRLDTYHDLKSLQARNMVEATISKPMKFRALPLDSILEDLKRKNQETNESRTNALLDLEKISKTLAHRTQSQNASEDKIQIIGGRKSISEKWSSLLSHAQKEILVAVIDKGSAKILLMRGMEEISKKMKAGVSVRIFTPITQSGTDQFKEVASEVRHLDSLTSAGVCIVDKKEVMIIPETTGNLGHSDETAIVITSPSIVEMFRILFFVGWDTSPLTSEMKKET